LRLHHRRPQTRTGFKKPCLEPGCIEVSYGSRCPAHTLTTTGRGYGKEWERLVAGMIREHVIARGWICPGWNRALHPVRAGDLEGDHIVPRSQGGQSVRSNARLLCSHCNRSRQAGALDRRLSASESR